MALFQKSVLNKYLREINDSRIAELYSIYSSYFLNLEIQQNIRDSKEEQFQEGFLRELFVNVLGYTINPNPNYNLTTELKNETGAKKADGAILVNGKAIGVIELKSTSTKDLESIRQQAFDYKANQSECVYVVTSNFEKLRFYIDNAVDYEEFDLFTLSLEQFKLLYLCLHVDSIMAGIPKTAKIASLVKEENVTKKLYADYSVFKERLFNSIIGNEDNLALANGTDDKEAKLILFKKTQKLMDRFLFIFFAEDRGLIPPNTISTILTEWEKLKSLDAYRPLYDRFKRHFDYINTGWKGDNYEVFAYNGGLFLPDEILDNITVSDEVLFEQTTILTKYDFDSEVDVNILGHIFEHSLNEIETMNAELEGQQIDIKKTKRKKDGVFYTPKYITKYIVDNTIGKLSEEKKEELSIVEDDYLLGKKGRKKETVKQLENKLTDYRDWLLQITVVDPACGSGAFLNQALEFLIREHRWIDEMTAKLFGGGLVFQDVENSILENNLYGVDINEESVEIAKLSLWLRTAQKGRKLTSLNNNIKCGNSLIDDPEVAGDKAFKWEEEFPKVFAKGGFDVVIGNPPYVQLQKLKTLSEQLKKIGYKTFEKASDLYCLFYEKGISILKVEGHLGYITSNKWMRANYGKSLRKYFLEETTPYQLIDLGAGIFEAAVVDSNILLLKKKKSINIYLNCLDLSKEIEVLDFSIYRNQFTKIKPSIESVWNIASEKEINLKQKIENAGLPLKDWNININYGIKTGLTEAFIIDNQTRERLIKSDSKSKEIIVPVLRGRDINRYQIEFHDIYLINSYNGYNNTPSVDINNFKSIKEYLETFEPRLSMRYDQGDTKYNLRSCAYLDDFNKPKIIWKEMSSESSFTLDNNGYFTNDTITFIVGRDLEYLLALLNSKIFFYLYSNYYAGGGLGNQGIRFKKEFLSSVPILYIEKNNQNPIVIKVESLLNLKKEFLSLTANFTNLLQSKYEIDKLSTKLQKWYELDFKQFIAELKKKKVVLSLSEEAEWMSYFNEKKAEAQELKSKIDATDNEIDLMVYKLYDLTYDEVLIVDPETKIGREVYGG